jgi:hypothetical protein
MATFDHPSAPTLRGMRKQIAVLVTVIAAAGAAELVVSTTDERDEGYWNSPPAPSELRAGGR